MMRVGKGYFDNPYTHPKYEAVIKNPMWFTSMLDRLEIYVRSPETFRQDIKLIIDNAKKWNNPKSEPF
jgi:hypothetical protein